MKKLVFSLLVFAALLSGCTQRKSTSEHSERNYIRFMVASDMGRTGISEQQNIAEIMGRFADENRVDFLAVAGDPIHYRGVQSIYDEEWYLKIESVYTAPSLHAIPWYVVSGNHEYNGSVQAILDYSAVSERWNAPARYFSFTKQIGNSNDECLFVFIDTTPLIDRYRNDPNRSDAGEQDMDAQLQWLDKTLASSDVRWKIVIGHHPVYATTTKSECERTDMQKRVGTIIENHGVDFFIAGHIHNFQHIQPEGSKINHVVNSSASRSRPVHSFDGLIFGNPAPGFSVFTVSTDNVEFKMINHEGEIVYSYRVDR